jgi:hypothetical protein
MMVQQKRQTRIVPFCAIYSTLIDMTKAKVTFTEKSKENILGVDMRSVITIKVYLPMKGFKGFDKKINYGQADETPSFFDEPKCFYLK